MHYVDMDLFRFLLAKTDALLAEEVLATLPIPCAEIDFRCDAVIHPEVISRLTKNRVSA